MHVSNVDNLTHTQDVRLGLIHVLIYIYIYILTVAKQFKAIRDVADLLVAL
jgi:hypothetical protein